MPSPTSLEHLGPALDDTDQECPPSGLCHPKLWAQVLVAPRWPFGPLLMPGKGIFKSKPTTDLCQP